MIETTSPRFYFQREDLNPLDNSRCSICGGALKTGWSASYAHNSATHEVYALLTWGMHAVVTPALPYVEAWASGASPLPSAEEYAALHSA